MATKIPYSIEYDFHASPQMIYQYLHTPSGLSEWFADNVNSRGEEYTFIWDDSEEKATLITKKPNQRVKFKWKEEEDTFFEFNIIVDEITKDVSLVISDFCEENELEESKMLWDNLVSTLKHILGSI